MFRNFDINVFDLISRNLIGQVQHLTSYLKKKVGGTLFKFDIGFIKIDYFFVQLHLSKPHNIDSFNFTSTK